MFRFLLLPLLLLLSGAASSAQELLPATQRMTERPEEIGTPCDVVGQLAIFVPDPTVTSAVRGVLPYSYELYACTKPGELGEATWTRLLTDEFTNGNDPSWASTGENYYDCWKKGGYWDLCHNGIFVDDGGVYEVTEDPNGMVFVSGDILWTIEPLLSPDAVIGFIAANAIAEPELQVSGSPTDEYCLTYESTSGPDFVWQPCTGLDMVLETSLKAVDSAADEECLTYESTVGDFEWQACGAGGGDSISVNSSAAADANFLDGDIDWTLVGASTPDDITATVACSGCIDATDLAANSVGSSELASGAIDSLLDFADLGCAVDEHLAWGGVVWYCTADSAGTPGGNTTELQYNNAGAFGGIASVETDGTHLELVAETSHPAAPAADNTRYDYSVASTNAVPLPFEIDSILDMGMPVGMKQWVSWMAGGTDTTGGNWHAACKWPNAHNGTAIGFLNANSTLTGTGTSGAVAWSSASFVGRQKWISRLSSTADNSVTDVRETSDSANGLWRGNAAGAGGFLVWVRFGVITTDANMDFLVGLTDEQSLGAGPPSGETNTVYIGQDDRSSNANLDICSNDATASSTCTDLGASYPTSNGAYYDVYFSAAPNASSIEYCIFRLDSAASTCGTVTTDLPANDVQLNLNLWAEVNTGGTAATIAFGGDCGLANM